MGKGIIKLDDIVHLFEICAHLDEAHNIKNRKTKAALGKRPVLSPRTWSRYRNLHRFGQ